MRNYAASVRAKLAAISARENLRFQILLTRYLHERLLYRLSQTSYNEHFCLKGGTLFYVLEGLSARPTKDLDLLGRHISNRPENMKFVFEVVCHILFEEDGVIFDAKTIELSEIIKEGNYRGTRIELIATLGQIREKLQIDIGFGDVVIPEPLTIHFPAILDLPSPELFCYSVETVISEKFHAMISLAEANSRMKDFYDLYRLLLPGRYDPETLRAALAGTFKNRQTALLEEHPLFTPAFGENHIRHNQWRAFQRKSHLEPLDFLEVHRHIWQVMEPYFRFLISGEAKLDTF